MLFSVPLDEAQSRAAGEWMHAFATDLYPICRSITGRGLRETLRRIGEVIPLDTIDVASGTQVYDWTVPPEWSISDAYIKDLGGNRIVDFLEHNLHVLNYSTPISAKMPLSELRPHLHTDPSRPDSIPYRTSYYTRDWGFCMPHRQLERLSDAEYEVCIEAELAPGSLTYGEFVLPGQSDDEVLISAHVCHPSLANDNLSGIAVAVWLAKELQRCARRRYTYRFLFAPGTIGAITWLARNETRTRVIRHGLVLACVGDPAPCSYKRSRRQHAEVDQAVEHVLRLAGLAERVHDFSPYGYDERQFCSPGFNLPVGCFMRGGPGGYPEYHSSDDNLEVLRAESLADTLEKLLEVLITLEGNGVYSNLNPKCEPQLGKRGLYDTLGGRSDAKQLQLALLWVLNGSDGKNSLLDIARRAGLPFRSIRAAADALLEAELLAPAHGSIYQDPAT